MQVAVITPYHNPCRAWLEQCHESVRAQSVPARHILVADGATVPWVDALDADHVHLPHAARDFGDTPRAIGSYYAFAQGYEAVSYLDDDNWMAPDHLASLIALQQAQSACVVTSARMLHRMDGSPLARCREVDGERFVDTNCMFLMRQVAVLVATWVTMDQRLHGIGDRVMWKCVRDSGVRRAHTGQPTVAYRTRFKYHYLQHGEVPPYGASGGGAVASAMAYARDVGLRL